MDKKTILKIRYLYLDRKKSVFDISQKLNCSENKISYWLAKSGTKKRSISDAIYAKHNPNGDPFRVRLPKDSKEAELFGMGMGLYWGEGTKASKSAVRLGNSDPALLNVFIKFLRVFFGVKKDDLRFHMHIFSDISLDAAYEFWIKKLRIRREQFYKPMITKTGKLGTYRRKSKYGVVTVYYCNKRLRDLLIEKLPL